jgi:GT2 family glycosyltransferase
MVDIVVVSFNSRATLRNCVEGLAASDGVNVIVVDNASTDRCIDTVRDLSIKVLACEENRGFAAGCNRGWRAGSHAYVLFLNPDAQIDLQSVFALLTTAAAQESVGAVGPKLLASDGSLEFSQRRFPTLASTYAQALFLHRLFPRSAWVDEVVRAPALYEAPGSPDWISGACVLVRRSVLELIDGWDESFFLYSEDTDLCRRIRSAGYDVRYEPTANAIHVGGQSSPRAGLLPRLAVSRIRYAKKHGSASTAWLQRAGVALSALTHMAAAPNRVVRKGHANALRTVFRD